MDEATRSETMFLALYKNGRLFGSWPQNNMYLIVVCDKASPLIIIRSRENKTTPKRVPLSKLLTDFLTSKSTIIYFCQTWQPTHNRISLSSSTQSHYPPIYPLSTPPPPPRTDTRRAPCPRRNGGADTVRVTPRWKFSLHREPKISATI